MKTEMSFCGNNSDYTRQINKLVWEWCHSLEAFSLSADFPVCIRDIQFILNEI